MIKLLPLFIAHTPLLQHFMSSVSNAVTDVNPWTIPKAQTAGRFTRLLLNIWRRLLNVELTQPYTINNAM
jgi:hypothetical protein